VTVERPVDAVAEVGRPVVTGGPDGQVRRVAVGAATAQFGIVVADVAEAIDGRNRVQLGQTLARLPGEPPERAVFEAGDVLVGQLRAGQRVREIERRREGLVVVDDAAHPRHRDRRTGVEHSLNPRLDRDTPRLSVG
jgi:hypothetical protein